MKINAERTARADLVIEAARATTTEAIIAHIRANPDQTESQVCYLAGAVDVLENALSSLATLPIEQRPYIVLSREQRRDSVRRLFSLVVESGAIVRTGWSVGGSAVYRVAS